MAVMLGGCESVVNSSGFNHAPFVIIRSGRVVGKAAFCRFLVIVSTIIYRSYPPESAQFYIFCFIHDCHKRPVSAVSGSYQSSVLLRVTRRAYTTR